MVHLVEIASRRGFRARLPPGISIAREAVRPTRRTTMAIDMFIHMHGGWAPNNRFTVVPKGCSVTFWSPYAKLLPSSTARAILGNTWTGQPDRVVGEYKSVPDFELVPLSVTELEGDKKARHHAPGRGFFSAGNQMRLSQAIEQCRKDMGLSEEINFHWLCCQELMLKRAGGGKFGVNAGDQVHKFGVYQFMWTDFEGKFHLENVKVKKP
ncbi:Hypothetical protein A7982_06936 [Minicystis rosea]|nr:Hypothetical protein A7982_06936 [Minicystis rosea]